MPFRTHNRCAHFGTPNTGASSPTYQHEPSRAHGASRAWGEYASSNKYASATFLPHSFDARCPRHAEWARVLSSTWANACTCSCTASMPTADIARASATCHECRHATCTKCEPTAARTAARCAGLRWNAATGTACTSSPQPAGATPANADAAPAPAPAAPAHATSHAAPWLVWSFATGSSARHESEYGRRHGSSYGRRHGTTDAHGDSCANATCSPREARRRSDRRTYGTAGY